MKTESTFWRRQPVRNKNNTPQFWWETLKGLLGVEARHCRLLSLGAAPAICNLKQSPRKQSLLCRARGRQRLLQPGSGRKPAKCRNRSSQISAWWQTWWADPFNVLLNHLCCQEYFYQPARFVLKRHAEQSVKLSLFTHRSVFSSHSDQKAARDWFS